MRNTAFNFPRRQICPGSDPAELYEATDDQLDLWLKRILTLFGSNRFTCGGDGEPVGPGGLFVYL